jgi:cation diffusion facilitator CzcD-associated flavoprotein CzcO
MSSLDALHHAVSDALSCLEPDAESWVPEREGIDHAVTIVGSGQSGLAAAFALRRKGLTANIIEAACEGDEGVWRHRARMTTLRTPKKRPGPEHGIPELTFRVWYTALHGETAYDELDRIPRQVWADYLTWFRKVLQIPVRFETRLLHVEPQGDALKLHIDVRGEMRTELTRKLVLAGGLKAAGGLNIPPLLASLPQGLRSHTDEEIDFAALRGLRVGILGASASGFDVAATALEAGVAAAHLFCRAPDLAHGARFRWADYPGADYFHLLSDEERWHVARLSLERGNHPPATSIARVSKLAGFHLHLGSPWLEARADGERVHVKVGDTTFVFDHVIAATGFRHDPDLAPELQALSSHVLRWKDRVGDALARTDPVLGACPYLGAEFQLQEKLPGAAPCLANVHVLNTTAFPAFLRIVGDIKCLGFTSERLTAGIVRDLFLADRSAHIARLSSPAVPELTGEEYAGLVWPGGAGQAQP